MLVAQDYNIVDCDYVKSGVLYCNWQYNGRVQIESSSDLAGIAATGRYNPGALAHTAGYQNIWELGADGEFHVVKSAT